MTQEKVQTGYTILDEIEKHVGEKISNGRIRFHLVNAIQRLIDAKEKQSENIAKVLRGAGTFDPNTQRVISWDWTR